MRASFLERLHTGIFLNVDYYVGNTFDLEISNRLDDLDVLLIIQVHFKFEKGEKTG